MGVREVRVGFAGASGTVSERGGIVAVHDVVDYAFGGALEDLFLSFGIVTDTCPVV
jgi:hypothetical protein